MANGEEKIDDSCTINIHVQYQQVRSTYQIDDVQYYSIRDTGHAIEDTTLQYSTVLQEGHYSYQIGRNTRQTLQLTPLNP